MFKRISILILVLSTAYCSLAQAKPLLVESFNLRYDNPADGIHAWPNRQALVIEHIRNLSADVIGMQEVLAHQWQGLGAQLPEYGQLGAGRDDGKQAGEFVPILYRKSRLQLIKNGYFWLSETPNQPGSIGWGAHLPRITSWAIFTDKHSQRDFCFFNTHFSHVSDEARQQAAKLLLAQIPLRCDDLPVIATGDFNAQPDDAAYRQLSNSKPLFDTASGQAAEPTYNGFGKTEKAVRIDYIFADKRITAAKYQTHFIVKDGVYISDHFPISVSLDIK
ncbi:endonuclease/exonuclease/phosphatase family protein [Bowmanella denitrificans]|uniref:Endonuclease/exonuclease/phosphatase family protein n=1 Tax=Bowmanella denitrificans TaxID=366582 RepID=A0ABN0WK89_9ALTE